MTTTIGVFNADQEAASLISSFRYENELPDSIPLAITALETFLRGKKTGLRDLIYADAETMRRDEAADGHYYMISPNELEQQSAHELPQESLAAGEFLVRRVLKDYTEGWGMQFTEQDYHSAVDLFKRNLSEESARREANSSVTPGMAVYLAKPTGISPVEERSVKFQPDYHDARRVLPASQVKESPKGKLVIYPMPPDPSRDAARYWGFLQNAPVNEAYFLARTQAALKKKAAIYEAWVEKFGK